MKTLKPYCTACGYVFSCPEQQKTGHCFCRDFPEQQSYEPSVNRAGGHIWRSGDGTPPADYSRGES